MRAVWRQAIDVLVISDPPSHKSVNEPLALRPCQHGAVCLSRYPDRDGIRNRRQGSGDHPEIYLLTAREIAKAIERLLQVGVLAIENEQEIFNAMVTLKQGRGSFAHALIAELGARGCVRTLTFDGKATRLPGFELV